MSIDTDIPLLLSLLFIVGGLVALVWSADRFVEAAAKIARSFGISPMIVGMVIVGFGTSAPELCVSVLSGLGGHANLSLGNAYGSCIFNIAGILGVTALVRPFRVTNSVNFVGVPLLLSVSLLSWFLVGDGAFERANGIVLLLVFSIVMPWYCWRDQKMSTEGKKPAADVEEKSKPSAGVKTWFWLLVGLSLLVTSSHLMVWGCVDFARDVLHVSDLMIGLTIVAIGTSLPELASSIAAVRHGEYEMVVGNIVGSNLFNTLAVVGIAGAISPFGNFSSYVVTRDLPWMIALSLSLAAFGINWPWWKRHRNRTGIVTRLKGVLWVTSFIVYLVFMIRQEMLG